MMKTSRVSRIYLCEPFEWSDDLGRAQTYYEMLLEEIDGLKIPSSLLGDTGPPLRVRIRNQNHADTLHLARHGKLPVRAYEDLIPIVVEANWPLDEQFDQETERNIAVTLFESYSIKLIAALSIYLPGSVRCQHAYTGGNRGPDLNMACSSEIQECLSFLMEHDIPPTPGITFYEFLKWLSKRQGFWGGAPATNLERAICSLTHMHHYHFFPDNINDFVWCMAAIEAMYTSTSASIIDQLKRRIKIALPDYQNGFTKKRLDNLYSYRSRLIHGDIAVPSRFAEVTVEEIKADRYDESFAAATSIAIKTIYRAAELGLGEIVFEEKLLRI